MKSIIQQNKNYCYLCGCGGYLEEHHVFEGTANRKISEKQGLKVYLCYECHRGNNGVHFNKNRMLKLKEESQAIWQSKNNKSKEDFIKLFGKSYL